MEPKILGQPVGTPAFFFRCYPHPILRISKSGRILDSNDAAKQLFAGKDLANQECCEIVFGRSHPCDHNCVVARNTPEACSMLVTGIAGKNHEEQSITLIYEQRTPGDSEPEAFFMLITPVPAMLQRVRAIREIENTILGSSSINKALSVFRNFLVDRKFLPYRVREYRTDNETKPTQLHCVWHDTVQEPGRSYISNLNKTIISRKSLLEPEFYALDSFSIVFMTANDAELSFYRGVLSATASKDNSNTFVAHSPVFDGFRLYRITEETPNVLYVFEGNPNSWLDIPLGAPGRVVGKMSITPQGASTKFAREDLEEIGTLVKILNAHIANIQLQQAEHREALLGTIHEVAQPALMALTSIESVRRRDRESRKGPMVDKEDYYAKKNIETAIRMVAFLNDRPRVSRDRLAYSPEPVSLLGHVLAPIVNMFRHEELNKALNERAIRIRDITDQHLGDVKLSPERKSQTIMCDFGTRSCRIKYDKKLENIAVYVDQYRIQQVFYNLLNNAVKYRDQKQDCDISVRLRDDRDFPGESREVMKSYDIIDVEDNGLGVNEDERVLIFGLGKRGSAARRASDHWGTGRGLFIVREILLSVGGDVVVESCRNPTTFRLFIPAACREGEWTTRIQELDERRTLLRRMWPDRFCES